MKKIALLILILCLNMSGISAMNDKYYQTIPLINSEVLSDIGYCLFRTFNPSNSAVPYGKILAESCENGTVKIYKPETMKCIKTLDGHKDFVASIQFSNDGSKVFTNSIDETTKVWDYHTADCLLTFGAADFARNAKFETTDIARFSNDGKLVLTIDKNTPKIWDIDSGECLYTLQEHEGKVTCAQFSSDGKKVITVSRARDFIIRVRVYDIENEQTSRIFWLQTHFHFSAYAEVCPDNTKALIVSPYGNATILDIGTEEIITTIKHEEGNFYSARLNQDASLAITWGDTGALGRKQENDGGIIKIWNIIDDQACLQYSIDNIKSRVLAANFSSDGMLAVSSTEDGTVQIWDVATGNCLQTLELGSTAEYTAFNSAGTQLWSGNLTIKKIWDNDNWRNQVLQRLALSARFDQCEELRKAYEATQTKGFYHIYDNSHELFLLSALGRLLPNGKIDYSDEAKKRSRELQQLVNRFAKIKIEKTGLLPNLFKKLRLKK